ncbi:MAG TPA: hypothetical protein VGQ28_14605, partial [Thermoanaerobaculia bacterium]|nr:hypothetical protein [Thermoanaerobaculia bacterium]
MSLWALAAAAALFGLLGLLGSRFASRLASPADGLLYRGVVYTMAGAVALHLVLTVLDFAGVRWSLPVLAVCGLAIAGIAMIASASPLPRPSSPRPSSPAPSRPPSPGEEGEQQRPLITPALFSHRPPPDREKREQGKDAPGVPLSRGGGWGGRERGRGEGPGWGNLGWGDALALFALAVFAALALSGWIAMPDYVYHWGLKGHRFYLARG